MSTESEQSKYSSDNETPKRSPFPYETDEKRFRPLEEPPNRFYPSVSPPPMGMMQRQGMDPHLNRMPTMHRPISPRAPVAEDSDLTDAMVFLNRIKEEYGDNLEVYDRFLETMRDFKFEKIDADEVCKAVRILFKDKSYLVRLFDEYLPLHLRHNEVRSCGYEMGGPQMQDRHKMHAFRPAGGFMAKPQPMHVGQMPPSAGMHMNRMNHPMPPNFLTRPMRQSPPPPMSLMNDQVQRYPAKPLPNVTPILSLDSPTHRKAHEFVQQVKRRYINKSLVYRQFVELLQQNNNEFDKLFTQVSALLQESPDLIEKFEKNFRNMQPTNIPTYMSESDPLKKIKATLAEQGNLEQFLKIINFYNQNYISAANLINLVEPLIDDKEQLTAFKSFIKYQEVNVESEPVKYKGLERFGSYKHLPARYNQNITGSAIAKEVINFSLVSVSTLESEDDTYVFRLKNHSEELLSRIVDERSEADLILDRLKFLIVKLEELYNLDHEGEFGLEDIQMSSALVKETLRRIYDDKSTEVLESILVYPKKSIPVILKRLKKVFKEYMEKMREYKKHWRSILEEHYYKTYDNSGVNYRMQERNLLTHKNIKMVSESPISIKVEDETIFNTIIELFTIFTHNHSSSGFRKPPIENQLKLIDSVIDNLKKDSFCSTIDFETYVLYYYVFILYARFNEVKNLDLPPLSSNPVAVSISYQEEFYISDRYNELLTGAKSLMNKEIDPARFEEFVRKLTDCAGYKLYNLKKIMGKIEKQINYLLDGVSDSNKDEEADTSKYYFRVKQKVATLLPAEETKDN